MSSLWFINHDAPPNDKGRHTYREDDILKWECNGASEEIYRCSLSQDLHNYMAADDDQWKVKLELSQSEPYVYYIHKWSEPTLDMEKIFNRLLGLMEFDFNLTCYVKNARKI